MRAVLGIAIALALSASCWAADKVRIRVTEFAPNYFQQDGRWRGLDVELAEAVVREAGLEPEFIDLPWSRALSSMQGGELHLMMNLTRTPDREVFMQFFGPERMSKRVLVVRRQHLDLKIESLDDLITAARKTGQLFGIQHDAKYSEAFDARLKSDPLFLQAFEYVVKGAVMGKMLAGGHTLGFFEDENYVAYQLKNNPDFKDLGVHPFVLASDPVFFGVSRRFDATNTKRLEDAFARLERNGSLAKIRARWGQADR
jgi:polar amino acid transport system substrate-binding protein